MIKMHNITKSYQSGNTRLQVLSELSLEIPANEFLMLMGPSGSGKSTFLNMLGMIDDPTEGEYWFQGVQVNLLSKKEKMDLRSAQISYIFQSFHLINDLDVFTNVELPLIFQNVPKRQSRERVLNVLEELGLTERMKHYPHQLSGGEQQRTAIARAVVSNPSLLLADEPTGNLDAENGYEVMQILKRLQGQGKTIVMVTHDDRLTVYADRLIQIRDGKLLLTKGEEGRREVSEKSISSTC